MLVRLKKTPDGLVLTCIRTPHDTQSQRSAHGGFFALHDLMHYATETTLGVERAFFGLLREGWPFEAFSDHADPRYQSTPPQAIETEHLVAALSRAFEPGIHVDPDLIAVTTDEINHELKATLSQANLPIRQLEPLQLEAIFARFDSLRTRWIALPTGAHLELEFPPTPS